MHKHSLHRPAINSINEQAPCEGILASLLPLPGARATIAFCVPRPASAIVAVDREQTLARL